MCGIIGYNPVTPTADAPAAFTRLFDESRVRGTHAYGIARLAPWVVSFRSFDWEKIPQHFEPTWATVAHTRYCQSGDWQVMENNQPIVLGDHALAFNGCIHMGAKEEFEAAFGVQCQTDNDGEIFMRKCLLGYESAEEWLGTIRGSFAGVWLSHGRLYAGRNARRPLWTCEAYGAKWVASTSDIFKRAGFPAAQELPPGVVTV